MRNFNLGNANIFFYSGLFLKITLGIFLASSFLSSLFIPVVNYFVDSGFSNPYQYFINEGMPEAFPYPALMLYIMAIPKILFGWISTNTEIGVFDLFIYRLPLLVADLTIFFILKSWLKHESVKKLILFYWLSPVLIYISYIHGQLDVIPIALLFVSLYFLFKERLLYTALFLGFAVATKTHISLTIPFFFLYLLSKNIKVRSLMLFILVLFGAFVLPNMPYILDSSFIHMVFKNQEQTKFFQAFLSLNGFSFYLIPASLLFLFIKGGLLKNYNKDIFIMFLGFSFSIILLFVSPAQGWYFWLIPFLAYFYIKAEGRSPLLFFGLQVFYIFYFIISKNADYLQVLQFVLPDISEQKNLYHLIGLMGIDTDKIVGISFTLLQTTLLVNCLWIYRKGLESYKKHRITSSPFLIGIGGDSGVGKTTISDSISQIFTPKNTTILRGDDMHKWQRGHEKWKVLTHLDPKANYLHKEINTLKKLKAGRKVYRSHYDHNTGTFTTEKVLKPNNITIFEGLHPFYISGQRDLYDLKIFIKPETQLVHHWKIIRDIEKRGYSKEKILEQIKKREKDSKAYIEKQSKYTDILIKTKALTKIKNIGDKRENPDIFFVVHLPNSIYLESVLDELNCIDTLKLKHAYQDNDKQILEIKGKVSEEVLEALADKLIPGLKGIGINKPVFSKDAFGVLMFLITYYIFEEADNDIE
jgi:uridine kinase